MFEEEKPAERAGYLLKLTREERTRKFSKRMAHEFRRLQWLVEDFSRKYLINDEHGQRVGVNETPAIVSDEIYLFLAFQNGGGTMSAGPTGPEMPAARLERLAIAVKRGIGEPFDRPRLGSQGHEGNDTAG
jgi:hypothetical protein